MQSTREETAMSKYGYISLPPLGLTEADLLVDLDPGMISWGAG